MSEKYVVRLKNAAIYYADNPFGSTSEAKLLQRGEMVLSDVNLCVAPGEFVYLLGRVGSGQEHPAQNAVRRSAAAHGRRPRGRLRPAQAQTARHPLPAPPNRHRVSGLPAADRPQRLHEPLLRDEGHGLEARRARSASGSTRCSTSGRSGGQKLQNALRALGRASSSVW